MRPLAMSNAIVGLAVLPLLLAGAGQIHAATVRIDFEDYNDGYNLNGVNLGGVTLTNPSGVVEVHEDRFGVGYRSATKAIASPAGLDAVNPLVGLFDSPVSYVSLWGGDAGTYPELDSWELSAFDAPVGGRRVGRVRSGSWDGSPYRRLKISAPEIWRFEARWTGAEFGIGYDNLQFATIPPPPEPTPPSPDPDPPSDTPAPSNASFKSSRDRNSLTVDFGELPLGSILYAKTFDLWNLPATGQTVALDFDYFSSSGQTDAFSTDLATFAGLAPSESQSFEVLLDTSTPGEFSAIYRLFVSDETATTQRPLRITFTGIVVPEPSTVVMAAVALLSFLAWWRRRPRAG